MVALGPLVVKYNAPILSPRTPAENSFKDLYVCSLRKFNFSNKHIKFVGRITTIMVTQFSERFLAQGLIV